MLQDLFTDYLKTQMKPVVAQKLASALRASGLENEAAALDSYFTPTAEPSCILRGSPWSDHICWTGLDVPGSAKPGDLWFVGAGTFYERRDS